MTSTTRVKSSIFISHSCNPTDNAVASKVVKWLRSKGHRGIFLDFDPEHGIPPGRDWMQELFRELESCAAVIILCSRASMTSKWCFAEITMANMRGIDIFPLKLDDCDLGSVLSKLQVIDFRNDREDGYRQLWRGLLKAGLDPTKMFSWDPDAMVSRGPYPGLSSFEIGDAAVFFGRESETRRFRHYLNKSRYSSTNRLSVIVGASGSGKSSFLKAGVLAQLRREADKWIVLDCLRPRATPLDRFRHVLEMGVGKPGTLRTAFDRLNPAVDSEESERGIVAAADSINRALEAARLDLNLPDARILFAIDQAEEVLGNAAGREGTCFLRLLRAILTAENESPLIVAATLRSDYLGDFQKSRALEGVILETFLLPSIDAGRFREIIDKPAKIHRLDLEDGLTETLLSDIGNQSDSLPLLAYTLSELYRRFGDDRVLTQSEYTDGLGRLEGCIRTRAEEVYTDAIGTLGLTRSDESDLEKALVNLARISEEGVFVRQTVPLHSIRESFQNVFEALTRARLLVIDSAGGSEAEEDDEERGNDCTFEVAHEALFEAWPRLKRCLNTSRAYLLWKRRFTAMAEEWDSTGRDGSRLLRAVALREADHFVAEMAPALATEESAFLKSSRHLQLKRRCAAGAVALVTALLIIGGTWLWQSEQDRKLKRSMAAQLLAVVGDSSMEFDPSEAEPFRELSGQPDDTRYYFIENALTVEGNARRFVRRADLAIQATVALDSGMKDRITNDLLIPYFQNHSVTEEPPSYRDIAAAYLATDLTTIDTSVVQGAIGVLARALAHDLYAYEFYDHELSVPLNRLISRVDDTDRDSTIQTIAAAFKRSTRLDNASDLLGALRLWAPEISSGEAVELIDLFIRLVDSYPGEAHLPAFQFFDELRGEPLRAVWETLIGKLQAAYDNRYGEGFRPYLKILTRTASGLLAEDLNGFIDTLLKEVETNEKADRANRISIYNVREILQGVAGRLNPETSRHAVRLLSQDLNSYHGFDEHTLARCVERLSPPARSEFEEFLLSEFRKKDFDLKHVTRLVEILSSFGESSRIAAIFIILNKDEVRADPGYQDTVASLTRLQENLPAEQRKNIALYCLDRLGASFSDEINLESSSEYIFEEMIAVCSNRLSDREKGEVGTRLAEVFEMVQRVYDLRVLHRPFLLLETYLDHNSKRIAAAAFRKILTEDSQFLQCYTVQTFHECMKRIEDQFTASDWENFADGLVNCWFDVGGTKIMESLIEILPLISEKKRDEVVDRLTDLFGEFNIRSNNSVFIVSNLLTHHETLGDSVRERATRKILAALTKYQPGGTDPIDGIDSDFLYAAESAAAFAPAFNPRASVKAARLIAEPIFRLKEESNLLDFNRLGVSFARLSSTPESRELRDRILSHYLESLEKRSFRELDEVPKESDSLGWDLNRLLEPVSEMAADLDESGVVVIADALTAVAEFSRENVSAYLIEELTSRLPPPMVGQFWKQLHTRALDKTKYGWQPDPILFDWRFSEILSAILKAALRNNPKTVKQIRGVLLTNLNSGTANQYAEWLVELQAGMTGAEARILVEAMARAIVEKSKSVSELETAKLEQMATSLSMAVEKLDDADIDAARMFILKAAGSANTTECVDALARALEPIAEKVETAEIVDWLELPMCVGIARKTVLKYAEAKTGADLNGDRWVFAAIQ